MVRASGIEPLTPTMSKLGRKRHKRADSIGFLEKSQGHKNFF
jgi:hypothetical protein